MHLHNSHVEIIKRLNPLKDSKFFYDSARWAELNPNYKYAIQDFENKDISRFDVIEAYNNYYEGQGDYIRAFLLTMIWGFSDTGYGTFRTNKYLSEKSNIELIEKSIDAVMEDKLELAFNTLKKINGLGVSYITKILYFAERSFKDTDYALIYDIRVASALIELNSPKEIYEIVSINPSSKFIHYRQYNELIHSTARNLKIKAESIEMFLFNQEF